MFDRIAHDTPLVRALDETLRGELNAQPHPLHHLHCPWCCPIEVLPHLAWARSVDHWNDRWPERVRRRVVADSFLIHQVKGSVGAVKRALASVHAASDLEEWFNTGGAVHTFGITAMPTENLLARTTGPIFDAALIDELRRVTDAAKPLRSHYVLTLRMPLESPLKMAGASVARDLLTTTARARHQGLLLDSPIKLAAATAATDQARATLTASQPRRYARTSVRIAGAASLVTRLSLTMEARPPH